MENLPNIILNRGGIVWPQILHVLYLEYFLFKQPSNGAYHALVPGSFPVIKLKISCLQSRYHVAFADLYGVKGPVDIVIVHRFQVENESSARLMRIKSLPKKCNLTQKP